MIFHLVLKGIAGGKANMVIGKGIPKCDRPLRAHHMAARCDQHQPVFGNRKCLQLFGGIDLVPDDNDLGDVSSHCAHNVAAGTLLQIDVDLRMLRQELGQRSGKKLGGCSRIGNRRTRPLTRFSHTGSDFRAAAAGRITEELKERGCELK
jgi:hypothetical protein